MIEVLMLLESAVFFRLCVRSFDRAAQLVTDNRESGLSRVSGDRFSLHVSQLSAPPWRCKALGSQASYLPEPMSPWRPLKA
jgi:hypothetical protein